MQTPRKGAHASGDGMPGDATRSSRSPEEIEAFAAASLGREALTGRVGMNVEAPTPTVEDDDDDKIGGGTPETILAEINALRSGAWKNFQRDLNSDSSVAISSLILMRVLMLGCGAMSDS